MKMYKTVICRDGFRLSVQASQSHYCSPKSDTGPYYSVEVYSDGSEPLLNAGDDGISGWTSSETLMKVITKHGGRVKGEIPPLAFKRAN